MAQPEMSMTDATIRGGLGQGKADWTKIWVPPFFKHPCVYDSHKKKYRGKRNEEVQGKKEEGKKEAEC